MPPAGRPYLFSNTMAPPDGLMAAMKVLEMPVKHGVRATGQAGGEHDVLAQRAELEAGFVIKKGDSPIVPVMLFNAKLSQDIRAGSVRDWDLRHRVLLPGRTCQGQARIRTQLSADHDHPDPGATRWQAFTRRWGTSTSILGLDKKGIIARYGS